MPDKAMEEIGRAFEEFKGANDKRLAAIEANQGVAELDDKLDKINATLDQFEGFNQKLVQAEQERQAQADKLDEIETVMSRLPLGGDPNNDPAAERRAAFMAWCRIGPEALTPERKAVLTIADDVGGGYLAPSEYVREIIKAEIEFSPIRTIARVRSTGQRSVMIPKRTGTFSAVWVGETVSRSETTGLAYGLEEIPTHEMSALVDISAMDLEDGAFDLEAELNAEFSEQFGVAEGTAFVTGNAVAKPEGFMTNGDIAVTNSGNATLVTADGLLSLFYGIKTAYSANAVWTINRTTLGSIRKLKDGNGQYLWIPGLAVGQPNSINGAPYVEVPDMADEGADTFPVAFGNFRRGYVIVDRIAIAVLRDPFTQATSGTIRFVARRRVAGQVVLAEAIRKLKCST